MNVWCLVSSVLAASSVWVALRPMPRSLVTPLRENTESVVPSITVVLGLVSVAIRQGSSIPTALDAVGQAIPGSVGKGMLHVAKALCRGVAWDEAWQASEGDAASEQCLQLLRDTLSDAWNHGASPVERLEVAMRSEDRAERVAIEQSAARLSVRLLIPTGLCFLPAFIAIGVIPSIASFL